MLVKRFRGHGTRPWLVSLVEPLCTDFVISCIPNRYDISGYRHHLDESWFAVVGPTVQGRWPMQPRDEYIGAVGALRKVKDFIEKERSTPIQEAGMMKDLFAPWHVDVPENRHVVGNELHGARASSVMMDEANQFELSMRNGSRRLISRPSSLAPIDQRLGNHPMRTPQPVGVPDVPSRVDEGSPNPGVRFRAPPTMDLDSLRRDLENFQPSDLARQEMYNDYIDNLDAVIRHSMFLPRHPGETDADFRWRLQDAGNAASSGVPVVVRRSANEQREYLRSQGVDTIILDEREVAALYPRYVMRESIRSSPPPNLATAEVIRTCLNAWGVNLRFLPTDADQRAEYMRIRNSERRNV
jgi:hypothetical protein